MESIYWFIAVFDTRSHSDPTYEAWKDVHDGAMWLDDGNSDPTYEAWKASFISISFLLFVFIPILPTRHGKPCRDEV